PGRAIPSEASVRLRTAYLAEVGGEVRRWLDFCAPCYLVALGLFIVVLDRRHPADDGLLGMLYAVAAAVAVAAMLVTRRVSPRPVRGGGVPGVRDRAARRLRDLRATATGRGDLGHLPAERPRRPDPVGIRGAAERRARDARGPRLRAARALAVHAGRGSHPHGDGGRGPRAAVRRVARPSPPGTGGSRSAA